MSVCTGHKDLSDTDQMHRKMEQRFREAAKRLREREKGKKTERKKMEQSLYEYF
jgi:hypothetical protein